jgi:tetratricopeptide (TPR) repeat protein
MDKYHPDLSDIPTDMQDLREMMTQVFSSKGVKLPSEVVQIATCQVLGYCVDNALQTLEKTYSSQELNEEQKRLILEMLDVGAKTSLKEKNRPLDALKIAELCIRLVAFLDDPALEAQMLVRKAKCLDVLGKPKERIDISIQAAAAWDRAGNLVKKTGALMSAASVAFSSNDSRTDKLIDSTLIAFQSCGEVFPEREETLSLLAGGLAEFGMSRLEREGPVKACQRFEKSLQMKDNAKAHVGLAKIFILEQRFNEAHDQLDKALSIDPSDAIANFEKAELLWDATRINEAINFYREVVDKYEGFSPAYIGVAKCFGYMATVEQENNNTIKVINYGSQAIDWLLRAEDISDLDFEEEIQLKFMLASMYNERGIAYTKLTRCGEEPKENRVNAESDLKTAIRIGANTKVEQMARSNLALLQQTTSSGCLALLLFLLSISMFLLLILVYS